jgi:beta-mannosidase
MAASFASEALSTGWEFKLTEETTLDSWLPVAKVPTTVHLDLLDNKKYDLIARHIYEVNQYNVEYPILPMT